ncbi:hybrid sensor histidine kinase/response regulator [Rhodoferax bucti]|uniref:hybrid sensor histidine kinase/response regulator n=1 Tax=Rhodoferax bucti TaxID=2576305 RepID=UPI0011099C93|nr:hybrid sensor histidine kinase/response regulator [Rhodoferax bucti]
MNASVPVILVVDDSYAVRQLTINVLRQAGYTVLEAEDGRQGLNIALEERPDVVLCDIHMPSLDGWGFMQAARASDTLATTPVLMLTSVNDRDSVRRAMAAGADDYLSKPWAKAELLQAVTALLDKAARFKADVEREKSQLRSAVMATIPHELRTPMVTLLGTSELLMLRRSRYSEARVQEMLEDIHRNAKSLTRLVTRMMDWAELNAGRDSLLPAARDVVDVVPAVRDVLWSHHFSTEAQAVLKLADAEVDSQAQIFGGHPVQVRLEPARIRCFAPDFLKIMTELLVNALRFSKPGRPVGVTGKPLGQAAYQLDIANLGVAMPEQFIAQIGALSQANRAQHEQQGMGLGLAISQLAARRNGASLHVPRIDGLPTVVRLVFEIEIEIAA